MNKLVAVLGSSALLAALIAGGFAMAQGTFAIAPVSASIAVQQDGTCRGHIEYAIALNDDAVANDLGVEEGSIEVKTGCARLTNLSSSEVFDTKGGHLAITVKGASVAVLAGDPDGAGPRLAGECDVTINALMTVVDADAAKVFKRPREIVRVKPNPTCGALTNLITNSCWVARGSWPPDAPFPAIAKCP